MYATGSGVIFFSFSHVVKEQILKEILSLDSAKANQNTDIPTNVTKDNADIFSDFLFSDFNNSVTVFIFPSSLKQAVITSPVFKKGDKNLKENYRPVSILTNVSKILELFLSKQISNLLEPLFPKQQGGFRKGYRTHFCLLSMFEK